MILLSAIALSPGSEVLSSVSKQKINTCLLRENETSAGMRHSAIGCGTNANELTIYIHF